MPVLHPHETVFEPNAPAPPPDMDLLEVEKEERSFLLRVFWWMAGALLLSALATGNSQELLAYLRVTRQPEWPGWFALGVLMLIANWVSDKVGKMPGVVAAHCLLGFAFLNGLVFDLAFRSVADQSFMPVYLASAGLFACIAAFGHKTSGDLFSKPKLAGYAVAGMVCSGMINYLLGSTMAMHAGSAVVVLLFLVLILQNLQFLRDLKFEFEDSPSEQKAAAIGALLLYLDLVLIFIRVLEVPGRMLISSNKAVVRKRW